MQHDISAGIPEHIDLTMDGVFRNGVREILTYKKTNPRHLPWDSNGNIKNEYINSANLIHNSSFYGAKFDASAYYKMLNNINKKTKNFLVIQELSEIIQMMKLYNFYIVNDMVIASPFQDMEDYDYENAFKYRKYLKSTFPSYNLYYSGYNTLELYARKFSKEYDYDEDYEIEVMLSGCENTSLTMKEIRGECLLCGNADEIRRKIKKIEFLNDVKKMIVNKNKIVKTVSCRKCGREIPIYYFGVTKDTKYCAECQLNELFTLNTSKHIHLNNNIWHDFYMVILRGRGFKSFYLNDDQSEEFSDTIDYYRQTRYMDNGRFLVRLPVRSHELETDLNFEKIIDEEEPDSNRWVKKPHRLFTSGREEYSYSVFDRRMINHFINRA